jgi:hypothetical protein
MPEKTAELVRLSIATENRGGVAAYRALVEI